MCFDQVGSPSPSLQILPLSSLLLFLFQLNVPHPQHTRSHLTLVASMLGVWDRLLNYASLEKINQLSSPWSRQLLVVPQVWDLVRPP